MAKACVYGTAVVGEKQLANKLLNSSWPLPFDSPVVAFCKFHLMCRISVYYARNKEYSSNIIYVSHFRLHVTSTYTDYKRFRCT